MSDSFAESKDAIIRFMEEKEFGEAGTKVVVEEKLGGEEASILLLVSGNNYSFLISSQDHKPIFDEDKGPHTGGMGAYAPTSIIDESISDKIKKKIVEPLMDGFSRENIDYSGVLYLGLMIDKSEPYVLEFNVRFGDPEAQAILPLLKDDLIEVVLKMKHGENVELNWRRGSCVDVVLASKGYPGKYQKGIPISINRDNLPDDVYLFHAGTELKDGNFYTSGGRVLNVAAVGEDIFKARDKVYNAIPNIHFEGMHFRRDIGLKEVRRIERV
ncbi:Phosphoribosylamine--glycine ligase [subsurface metagenome]